MNMTKFASEYEPGFLAVAGELRRWSKQLTQVAAPGSLSIQQEHKGHFTDFGRTTGVTSGRQNTFGNGGSVVNQSGQQTNHGDLNINR